MRKGLVPLFAAAILGLAVSAAMAQRPPATEPPERVAVAGTAMQMMQLDGRYFTKDGADIIGLAYPVTVLCPGGLDFTAGTCAPSSADGLQGMIVAVENVVRHDVGTAGSAPTFEMKGPQMFSGWLMFGGQRYYGTLMLEMEFGGPLRTPEDIDCYNTPHELTCGAAAFSGTWRVLPRHGGGDLRGVTGQGTIVWKGCTNPKDTSTCSMPEFSGVVLLPLTRQGPSDQ